mmetsp:Transcript_8290/g.21755  ORF Transcript_8290/g.21755 Transcript_8290/m.21755 type:complete len:330 (+) Transcript_8290:992-1981(+)
MNPPRLLIVPIRPPADSLRDSRRPDARPEELTPAIGPCALAAPTPSAGAAPFRAPMRRAPVSGDSALEVGKITAPASPSPPGRRRGSEEARGRPAGPLVWWSKAPRERRRPRAIWWEPIPKPEIEAPSDVALPLVRPAPSSATAPPPSPNTVAPTAERAAGRGGGAAGIASATNSFRDSRSALIIEEMPAASPSTRAAALPLLGAEPLAGELTNADVTSPRGPLPGPLGRGPASRASAVVIPSAMAFEDAPAAAERWPSLRPCSAVASDLRRALDRSKVSSVAAAARSDELRPAPPPPAPPGRGDVGRRSIGRCAPASNLCGPAMDCAS